MKTFTIALRATIVTLVLTGLIYPFVMTGLAQVLFPWRANGSLVTDEEGPSHRLRVDCPRIRQSCLLSTAAFGGGREGL